MTTQKRIVATEWASQIDCKSTIRSFMTSNHALVSLNLKQLAITPRGIAKSSKKYPLPNDLMKSETDAATMHMYEPNIRTVVFSAISPGMSPHIADPLQGLWGSIKADLERNFKYELIKPLTVQRMTTFNFVTKSTCVWHEQSFFDYDHNVSRLVLRTINNKPADDEEYSTLVEVAAGLRYKDCNMVGKVHYSCPLV